MFLTFEGIDGCGKTTQLQLLAAELERRGLIVQTTREPGGTALAENLRDFLLHSRDALDARAELLLFGASRAQHVSEVIRPALLGGKWVLSDRFADSSEAYQGAGLGLDADFIRAMNAFATGNLAPDLTFFLDVAPEIALERRQNQNLQNDRIEARGMEFQSQVRAAYLEIARRESARFVVLDANQNPAEIAAQIRARLWD